MPVVTAVAGSLPLRSCRVIIVTARRTKRKRRNCDFGGGIIFQRKDLFEGTRPAWLGIDGETEIPILYYKDACAYFYFTADAEAVQKRLPSDNLHVVKVSPTRCMVALATYNYIHASVGSYGETVMVAICTQDKVPKGPLPLIRQARDAHFGTFVFHCPVTTQ